MEPQGAREFSVYLHDPWTEAVMRVVFMDASPHGLGFLPREDRRKEFHDAGVGTHCYQRLEVIIDPGAQPQPRRLNLHPICIIIDPSHLPCCAYSCRRASSGSIRVARRAGIQAASSATAHRNTGAARNASGSLGATPNSK